MNWIKAQLADPTSAMHGLAFIIIAGEIGKHWVTKSPVDFGAISAGMGLFTCGGVMDHYQDKAQ